MRLTCTSLMGRCAMGQNANTMRTSCSLVGRIGAGFFEEGGRILTDIE